MLSTTKVNTGSAVDFTGGRARINHDNDLNTAGDYTLQGFLKWTSSDFGHIYTKNGGSPGYIGTTLYINAGPTGTSLNFREGPSTKLLSTATGLNDGQWRHVAIVRRGDEMEIWINGELDATTTAV